jgi:type IV secretion system protein VirB9
MISLLVLAVSAAAASAQQRPSTDWAPTLAESAAELGEGQRRRPPQRANPLSGPDIRLTPKERQGVKLGKQWADNPELPARGADGSVVFVFGATLPVVVCAPLYVCDLTLQPGEVVNDLNIGDGVRWQIHPATQGAGENVTTHVIIKPTDIGLITNLIITTDRRAYTIKLISRQTDWMPRVSFFYPDDVRAEWGAYRAQQIRQREVTASIEPSGSAANLNFGFEISGDSPSWRPVRVYANRQKTYIQFPTGVKHGDLPALVALGDDGGLFTEPSKQLVNYRYIDGSFEVDKILDRAALISGVGWDQATVTITRRGKP